MKSQISFRLILAVIAAVAGPSHAATVPANFTSVSSIPVISPSYNATGNDVAITLGFAPPTGANLTIVKNTGLTFITGKI